MLIRIQRQLFIGIAALWVCGSASAQSISERAASVLDLARAEHGLVGVSAAVAVDGEMVWSGGAGFADRENAVPATGAMVHRIASISKAMTATAVMQLVEAGTIDLDATVQTYVPEYPETDRGPIRIRHLLTHTSGIRHYSFGENRPMEHYPTLAGALEVFKDARIPFEPGTRYRYTTYGYTLLGAIIEAATDETYAAYMGDYVWGPAGMTHTSIEVKGETVPNKSRLYVRDDTGAIVEDEYTDLSVKIPGGGIQSTAGDLARFAIAIMENRLISAESREAMLHAPDVPGRPEGFLYGFGWIYGTTDDGVRYYGHDGGQAGTTTNLLILPERGVAVAVLANLYGVPGEVKRITQDLADLVE